MKTLKRLLTRSVVGSAAGTSALAVIGCVAGIDPAASMLAVIGSKLLDQATGVGANLLASNLESAWAGDPVPGFNHDFRKALARALVASLDWRDQAPRGPLQARLHAETSLAERDVQRLLQAWQKHVQAALDSLPAPQRLEGLFPPGRRDGDYLEIASSELNADLPLLWEAVYADTTPPELHGSLITQMLGGDSAVRAAVLPRLAAIFPAQLAEILKQDEFKRGWIAFQKVGIERTLATVRSVAAQQTHELAPALARLEAGLARLAATESTLATFIDQQLAVMSAARQDLSRLQREQSQQGELLGHLLALARQQVDPPLRLPFASPERPCGLRALHFSEHQAAELIGRDREVQALGDFVDAPAPVLWWGLVGAAGTGKSRLALDAAEAWARQGWDAGFLPYGSTWLSEEAGLRAWRPRADTLIVLDYAAARAAELLDALGHLHDMQGHYLFRVRLLLLDRPGALGPLFADRLHASGRDVDQDKRKRAERLLWQPQATKPATTPVRTEVSTSFSENSFLVLDSLPSSCWRPLILEASPGLAGALPSDDAPLWQQLARLTDNGKPLLLLLAAEALAAQAPGAGPLQLDAPTRDALLNGLIEHEAKRTWRDATGITSDDVWQRLLPAFERAILLVTLTQGMPWGREATDQALCEVAGLPAHDNGRETLLNALPSILGLQPAEDTGALRLNPLQPDLFGEYLLLFASGPNALGRPRHPLPGLVAQAMRLDAHATASALALTAADFGPRTLPALMEAVKQLPADACAVEWPNAAFASALAPLGLAIHRVLAAGVDLIQSGLAAAIETMGDHSPSNLFGLMVCLMLHQSNAGPARLSGLDNWLLEPRATSTSDALLQLQAMGLSDAISCYGTAKDWPALEHWGQVLHSIASARPEFAKLQFGLAEGAFYAISKYATAMDWPALERWGKTLHDLAAARPDHAEVQLELAKGASSAIYNYGTAKDWPALERWGKTLHALAAAWPDNAELQLELAKGASNAVYNYGTAKDWPALERWGKTLHALAAAWPDNAEVQLELARGAFYVIGEYSTAKEWPALERWDQTLHELAAARPDHAEVQHVLAHGAFYAISEYATATDWPALERWDQTLHALIAARPDRADVQFVLSAGAVSALWAYGTAEDWPALERWGQTLHALADAWPDHAEVQHLLAHGAVQAIWAYSTAKDWLALERWGRALHALADARPDHAEVQLELAKGASRAINDYAVAKDWQALERWGQTLHALAAARPDHTEVQLELAEGAVNAISSYGASQNWPGLERWQRELFRCEAAQAAASEVTLVCIRGAMASHLALHQASLPSADDALNPAESCFERLFDAGLESPLMNDAFLQLTLEALRLANQPQAHPGWSDLLARLAGHPVGGPWLSEARRHLKPGDGEGELAPA